MKMFILLLLTSSYFCRGSSAVVPASHSYDCKKEVQHNLLQEIIDDVNGMEENQSLQIFVENVITAKHCTLETFCKAGKVLSKFKSEHFGLKENDWRLPRTLLAYSKKTTCHVLKTAEEVELNQLLHNIKQCAQEEYRKSCLIK